MGQVGRWLIVLGIALVLIGAVFWAGERLGLGRLPGDLVIKRKNVTIAFPIATSILLSLLLTLIVNLWLRRHGK